MHKLDKTNRVGRLLALVHRKEPKENFSFFFPVEGLEELTRLRKLTAGLQKTSATYEKEYEFQTFSVADIGRIRYDFPDVDEMRIWWMDIEAWIDEQGQFTGDLASRVLERRLNYPNDDLPDLVVGAVTKEKDFFDQQDLIDRIWKSVYEGKSLLLAAPRRFGKSSLINHLADHAPEGVKACYIDLEKGASPTDFIRLILKGLMDSQECRECLPPAVRKRIDLKMLEQGKVEAVREQSRTIEQDWRGYGRELFERMNSIERRFVLMLDEFSWLLEEMVSRARPASEEIQKFLDWLEEVCLKYNNLSVIVTGSEHLDSYLEALHFSGRLINTLERMNMEPFDEQTVKTFTFLALFKKEIIVTPPDLKAIIDLLGRPIPYFLQMFLDLLQSACQRPGKLPADAFQDVFLKKMLGSEAKRYFEYVDHQIERYARYGIQTDSVKRILTLLSREEQIEISDLSSMWAGLGGGQTFEFLMALLGNDFFVVERKGRVSMECKVFRDYFNLRADTLNQI